MADDIIKVLPEDVKNSIIEAKPMAGTFTGKLFRGMGIDPDRLFLDITFETLPTLAGRFRRAENKWNDGNYMGAVIKGGTAAVQAGGDIAYNKVFTPAAAHAIVEATEALGGEEAISVLAGSTSDRKPTTIGILADAGDEMSAHLEEGNPLSAVGAAAAGEAKATGHAVQATAKAAFDNAMSGQYTVLQKIIASVVGGIAGFIPGRLFLGQIGGTVLACVGAIAGLTLMPYFAKAAAPGETKPAIKTNLALPAAPAAEKPEPGL